MTGAERPPALTFANGHWFDGRSFRAGTMHSVDGRLSVQPPPCVEQVVDLAGAYVVPPCGEAHNHNLHTMADAPDAIRRYTEAGVFYVLIPNDMPTLSRVLRPLLDRPESVDAIFAHGGFTSSHGHPIGLYARLAERDLLPGFTADRLADEAYYVVDSPEDLRSKWPLLMDVRPDLIKTYLVHSEERNGSERRVKVSGLDPALLPPIVERAHRGGLRVAAHVETAGDFHLAVTAGVDIVAHLPGHVCRAGCPIAAYEIDPADARLAAACQVIVVTTAALARRIADSDRFAQAQDVQRRNLETLLSQGVRVAIGSDNYGDTSAGEADYLRSLGVVDDAALLRMWCCDTPSAIFPHRRIGKLEEGFEASFLVLDGNPLQDWTNMKRIRSRIKDGVLVRGTA